MKQPQPGNMKDMLEQAIRRTSAELGRSNHPRDLATNALHRATRLARRGRKKDSAKYLQRAYDCAAGLGRHPGGLLLRQQAAEEMYLLGQRGRAVRMIEAINDQELARIGWSQIAEDLIKQGHWADARKPILKAGDPGLMSELYLTLFFALNKARKYWESEKALNQAAALARGLEDPGHRAELLLAAAESCAKADQPVLCSLALQEAADQVAGMQDGHRRWNLLLRTARGWLLVGDDDMAISLVEKLLALIDYQGVLDGLEMEDRQVCRFQRDNILYRAADTLMRAGRPDWAKQVLQRIPPGPDREQVIFYLASASADKGYMYFAQGLCQEITKPTLRLMVMASLAGGDAEWGGRAKAARELKSVLEQAGSLSAREAEKVLLWAAGVCRSRPVDGIDPLGLTEQAYELEAYWSGGLVHRIGYYAKMFVEHGAVEKAVRLAESLPDPADRLCQLEQIYHLKQESLAEVDNEKR